MRHRHLNMTRYLLLVGLMWLIPMWVGAQEGPQEVEPFKDQTAFWTGLLAFITALIALVVAVFTARRTVKKKVEEEVKAKAKMYVDEFFAKELHIDPNTARSFFEQYQSELDCFAKQSVTVIHHVDDTDQKTLVRRLKEAGFATTVSRTIEDQIDVEAGDILLFDATQHLGNKDIDLFVDPSMSAKAKLLYYGGYFLSDRNPPVRMDGYSNLSATIINRIKEVTLS